MTFASGADWADLLTCTSGYSGAAGTDIVADGALTITAPATGDWDSVANA